MIYKIESDSATFRGHFEELDSSDFQSLLEAKQAIPKLREVGFTSNLRIVDEEGAVIFESPRPGFEDAD